MPKPTTPPAPKLTAPAMPELTATLAEVPTTPAKAPLTTPAPQMMTTAQVLAAPELMTPAPVPATPARPPMVGLTKPTPMCYQRHGGTHGGALTAALYHTVESNLAERATRIEKPTD